MTAPSDLYELKVIIEADGWHEMATLMACVDRALDPHVRRRGGSRRWSVIANRLSAGKAHELLWCVEQDERPGSGDPAGGRMSA